MIDEPQAPRRVNAWIGQILRGQMRRSGNGQTLRLTGLRGSLTTRGAEVRGGFKSEAGLISDPD
jgi:hypothetical protein